MSIKNDLRQQLRNSRQNISKEQRKRASLQAMELFQNLKGNTLSFASFNDEIDLWNLNTLLGKRNQLILPKVEGNELILYKVENFALQLSLSKWGIFEPIPEKCAKITPEEVKNSLIPGLGFDRQMQRIGYGKGLYDRLLSKMEKTTKIGIGFTQQLLNIAIPTEPHDHSLNGLSLFGEIEPSALGASCW